VGFKRYAGSMRQQELKRCVGGCCRFVDGVSVNEKDYEDALKRHPGSYIGIERGKRNANMETIIECRHPDRMGV
jgi:hypothetical protein